MNHARLIVSPHAVALTVLGIMLTHCGDSETVRRLMERNDAQDTMNADEGGISLLPTPRSLCSPITSFSEQKNEDIAYDSNVELSLSFAIPGESGVGIALTEGMAIVSVNHANNSSSLFWFDFETGKQMRELTFAEPSRDLAYRDGEYLALAVGDEIVRLSAKTGKEKSRISLMGVKRLALAKDGHLGAISGKTVYLFDENDHQRFVSPREGRDITDLAVRSCGEGKPSVFVTSFRNATFRWLGKTNPVQIARLDAIDFEGTLRWSLFGHPSDTIQQNVADTRLYRAKMGRDGHLYIGGESAGTASIFRWNGQPMTPDEQQGKADPFLTRHDVHTLLHNSGASHLAYFARVEPDLGVLLSSQFTFPRLREGKSNTFRIGDIASDIDGTFYFGGEAYAWIKNRDRLTINGISVGNYADGDRSWLAVSPDFKKRLFWTVLAVEPGPGRGRIVGVDAGYGVAAALSNVKEGPIPITLGRAKGNVLLSFVRRSNAQSIPHHDPR